jgi:phosphoglycerate dehydrogenase-like enzyme
MLNSLKYSLKKYLKIKKNRKEWQDKKKERVIIQLNKYFTQESWKESLQRISDYDYEYVFFSNHNEIIHIYRQADFCFLFGIPSFINLERSTIQNIYFPMNGLEFIDRKNLPKHIKIMSNNGIAREAIAEYCLHFALTLSNQFQFTFYNVLEKLWDQKQIINMPFEGIRYKKIGIMGMGPIGKAIAINFKNIGCTILGFDRIKDESLNYVDVWYDNKNLNDFLGNADFVIIALPLTEDTKNLFDFARFKAMKESSYLINIARGSIVNQNALINALEKQIIKGAVMDTLIGEPIKRRSALWKVKNLIITPHIAGNINRFVKPIQQDFIDRVLRR